MSDTTIEGGRERDAGPGVSGNERALGTKPEPERNGRTGRILAAGLGALVVAWVVANFAFGHVGFAAISSEADYGLRMISRIDKLLAALVLFLLAAGVGRQRLCWVAAGLLLLGFGRDVFNFLAPLVGTDPGSSNIQLYESWLQWTFVGALLIVGLLPDEPPRFSWWSALGTLAAYAALSAVLGVVVNALPPLAEGNPSWGPDDVSGRGPLPGLTGWHYALFALPVGLTLAAAWGTARHNRGGTVGGWLTVAMVLLAGAELHGIFWPFPHPEAMSSTRILYHAVSATVIVGGILELRRIAAERSALLAAEHERLERLRELSVLKADFTAMIAHELGNPLAAIQGYADMLSSGKLSPDRRERTLGAIHTEVEALNALIDDVRATAAIERDDFEVTPRPVPVEDLLADAAAHADTLPGDHPLVVESAVHDERVLADTERVGQILRNLLQNAARYSPAGTPIGTRADLAAGRVRISVADRGPGIHPDDLPLIFEKFGRGRNGNGRSAAGAGVGLYLSRRIARAHGGDLTVQTTPGKGSVFAFELEVETRVQR